MDAQTIRRRSKEEDTSATAVQQPETETARREKKLAMAHRGLRSLAIALGLPLFLSILSSSLSSWPSQAVAGGGWRPAAWAMHTLSGATACVMGLSAWLVWAEGGMKSPAAAALYVAQLVLGLAWAPVVMRAGAGWAGVGISVAMAAALVGCARCFRRSNPVASDLVKPCIMWAGFMAVISYMQE
ncbi:hypothetical protein HPP92_016337 [Vanilla planifolia]|uniref:Translocator protein homolog n=1 Tax=Vanilla planifolia TaxID=51239 RepID=A0A835UU40_VANPL|nr:hypothetical protein HPP92_016940 [Vanilla planifolia]KAG0471791.1 hypothetical protein HPP92_016337 [Vanilla planifolia]